MLSCWRATPAVWRSCSVVADLQWVEVASFHRCGYQATARSHACAFHCCTQFATDEAGVDAYQCAVTDALPQPLVSHYAMTLTFLLHLAIMMSCCQRGIQRDAQEDRSKLECCDFFIFRVQDENVASYGAVQSQKGRYDDTDTDEYFIDPCTMHTVTVETRRKGTSAPPAHSLAALRYVNSMVVPALHCVHIETPLSA